MTKVEMIETIIGYLKTLSDRAESGRKDAQNEANQHVGAMQSRYDTFKEEAQYLASAQGLRKSQLDEQLRALKEVRAMLVSNSKPSAIAKIGSIVTLEDEDGVISRYFLAPGGGGLKLDSPAGECIVGTPSSPLGRAVMNKSVGDEVKYKTGKGVMVMELIDIL